MIGVIKLFSIDMLKIYYYYTFLLYKWLFSSFLFLKKRKNGVFFKFFEWLFYDSRDPEDKNLLKIFNESIEEGVKYFIDFSTSGNFGLLFDTIDIKTNKYEKYKNYFNRNLSFLNIFKKKITTWSYLSYRLYKKSFFKNFLSIKSIFGKYINFYKNFTKKEFFLFMNNQNILNSKTVDYRYEEMFTPVSVTQKLFKFYLKNNNHFLYYSVDYKNIINNYTHFWILSPYYDLNFFDLHDYNFSLNFLFTNNMYNVYYIYKNTIEMDELDLIFFKNIDINLEMEKISNFPEDRYIEQYVIQDLNNNGLDFFINSITLYNKFYIIETYKILILLTLNNK